MTETPARNIPPVDSTYDIGWILVAAVLSFALFGLLGLGMVAVALVIAWIVGFGGG